MASLGVGCEFPQALLKNAIARDFPGSTCLVIIPPLSTSPKLLPDRERFVATIEWHHVHPTSMCLLGHRDFPLGRDWNRSRLRTSPIVTAHLQYPRNTRMVPVSLPAVGAANARIWQNAKFRGESARGRKRKLADSLQLPPIKGLWPPQNLHRILRPTHLGGVSFGAWVAPTSSTKSKSFRRVGVKRRSRVGR